MKIFHLEDEWPKARSIAHRLHDRVFESLAPQQQVDLDLAEEEDSASERPSTIRVTLKEKLIFEYVFVTTTGALQAAAGKDDVVIVDIMRSTERGYFVSILDEVLAIFRTAGHSRDNWRYFSAYPERVPDPCELTGFAKKQDGKLLQFLFERVEGRLK